jgi:myosin heavy subunit
LYIIVDGYFDSIKAMKWMEYFSKKRKFEGDNTQLEYNAPGRTFYVQDKCLRNICNVKTLMKDDIFSSIVNGQNNKIEGKIQDTFFNLFKVDNCINLLTISPSSVLLTLRLRYFACPKPLVYTFAGSVLLCINPFSQEPYTFNAAQIFTNETTNILELPPHPFTVSEMCFRRLRQTSVKQTIIVSGDSGAGKTETAKLLMNYLAARNSISSADPNSDICTCHDEIYQSLSRMNPILECFGNAVTCRNNNSSRFGRLNELYFRNGVLTGAGVKTYLLERSRTAHPDKDERNFHIFYSLLKGRFPIFLVSLFWLKEEILRYCEN